MTFKGVINPLQKFRIYNSGSNHSLGFLEKVSDGIYSARIKWIIGSEGNTSLWAYQYPDRGTNNDVVINDSVVSTSHAIITVSDFGEISIEDLKSKNGTFVNG